MLDTVGGLVHFVARGRFQIDVLCHVLTALERIHVVRTFTLVTVDAVRCNNRCHNKYLTNCATCIDCRRSEGTPLEEERAVALQRALSLTFPVFEVVKDKGKDEKHHRRDSRLQTILFTA